MPETGRIPGKYEFIIAKFFRKSSSNVETKGEFLNLLLFQGKNIKVVYGIEERGLRVENGEG
jgi:hypothetical protein